jgi:hypothetical protein
MSRILLQLQKKHNVMAGNIRKLSIELLAPGMILGFRKENLAQNDVANFVRNLENKLVVGNFVWNCENKTLLAGQQKIACWRNTIRKHSLELRCRESCYNCKKNIM